MARHSGGGNANRRPPYATRRRHRRGEKNLGAGRSWDWARLNESGRDHSAPATRLEYAPVAHAVGDEIWSFGQFRVCPKDRWVERSGVRLGVGDRALDLLLALLERAGEVVSKRALLERAWPSSMVDEVSLRVQITAIRRLLGDGKDGNRFI